MANENATALPYASVAGTVLNVIYRSLETIYESRFNNAPREETLRRLLECANELALEDWAKPPGKKNPHITGDLQRRTNAGGRQKVPRISRLCLEAVAHAGKPSSELPSETSGGIFVPSPLAIMVEALTVPERPESSAYSFALARAILLEHYKISPPSETSPKGWTELSLSDVQDYIESFRIYATHRDNVHYPKSNSRRVFLAHFLALSGTFVLRFGTVGKERSQRESGEDDCLRFLRARDFLKRSPSESQHYEFRLAPELVDLPDTQEILNTLMGVPIPIPGASTVFFGGLQRSHRDSLVVSVSGAPGTGKTTFALALAATLAPFGTKCMYCTFEDDRETLRRRALSLVPSYFRRSTILPNREVNWLTTVPLDSTVVDDVKSFTADYVSKLREQVTSGLHSRGSPSEGLPAIAPFLVVIDSLTNIAGTFFEGKLDAFVELVRELKKLDCIVLLLSAEEIPHASKLEYLVDTVISLRHEGTENTKMMPFRLFKLQKTRLQMSRPGAHILHLAGDHGFRLSPQLPSQLDSHKTHRYQLPERDAYIDTLRVDTEHRSVDAERDESDHLVRLYPLSRILVHGHGSSGKAAMALRILMSSIRDESSGQILRLPEYRRPRILVVSFLYPEEYYKGTFKKLKSITRRHSTRVPAASMDVWALSPSFILPEDFIGRVLLALDKGHLEGLPYTGVLLDGLHNTFLQFPMLQSNDMVWPALYSLLSKYEVTITTTFTTFSKKNSAVSNQRTGDEEFILKGQLPFLHALVKGTDFLLRVEPRLEQHVNRVFSVTVESAQGQRLRPDALVWNGDEYRFEKWDTSKASDDGRAEG